VGTLTTTGARLVASFFGCGLAPVMPGSVGSLAALVLGWPLLLLPGWVLPVTVLVATFAGLWAIKASGAEGDPGWVVIDEVAGQWLTLLGLAQPTVSGLLAAFVLFRFLDITKFGPIGWGERQPGAAGVIVDDLIAGAIAAGILWVVRWRWPGVL
jgi:phosphatidylglycerophosphatase A